jgi:outer membrane receptor for Fe3+-dicitrate
LNYRAANWSGNHSYTDVFQGSMSYVTGGHAAKFGLRVHLNHSLTPDPRYNDKQLKYNFQNGVPYQFTMYADQASQQQQKQNISSLYVQDRWTLGRLTVQGGLRFERLTDYFRAADRAESLHPHGHPVPRSGRPPQSQGRPAAPRRVV